MFPAGNDDNSHVSLGWVKVWFSDPACVLTVRFCIQQLLGLVCSLAWAETSVGTLAFILVKIPSVLMLWLLEF